ncbi:MAG: helix-turn-helix transcriptional regulator [Lentisphaeria bacterium]|nr:helix-turn-helix transcriptional regulator [Lentisphaeria bacterium]
MHANAWPLIEKYLKLRKKQQRDLAELLEVTPAAISQFKKERILFNPSQIGKIINYLQISQTDCDELYSILFSTRLMPPKEKTPKATLPLGWEKRLLPVGELELLRRYEPGFEPMDQYLLRHTQKHIAIFGNRPGLCLVTLGPQYELFGKSFLSALLLDALNEPSPEDFKLVYTQDREFNIIRPTQNRDGVYFDFIGQNTLLRNRKILWQRPILALDIPLE